MPAPFKLAVFADEDGDEFPVRVGLDETRAEAMGREAAQELIDRGDWRPRGTLHLARIEDPFGARHD